MVYDALLTFLAHDLNFALRKTLFVEIISILILHDISCLVGRTSFSQCGASGLLELTFLFFREISVVHQLKGLLAPVFVVMTEVRLHEDLISVCHSNLRLRIIALGSHFGAHMSRFALIIGFHVELKLEP